jgi:glucan 1,3-beta-glucosidase
MFKYQGDGQIPTSAVGNYSAFPPTSLIMKTGTVATATVVLDATQVAMLPTYTQTGSPVTLTHSAVPTNIDPGNGWANAQDTAGAYVAVGGCTYPR